MAIVDQLVTKIDVQFVGGTIDERPSRHVYAGGVCQGKDSREYSVKVNGEDVTRRCHCADEGLGYAVLYILKDGKINWLTEPGMLDMELVRGDVVVKAREE